MNRRNFVTALFAVVLAPWVALKAWWRPDPLDRFADAMEPMLTPKPLDWHRSFTQQYSTNVQALVQQKGSRLERPSRMLA